LAVFTWEWGYAGYPYSQVKVPIIGNGNVAVRWRRSSGSLKALQRISQFVYRLQLVSCNILIRRVTTSLQLQAG